MTTNSIDVAAGVIRDAEDRVLVAKRPAGKVLAGWWEFPGGKIEPGESPLAALVRELQEELGILVDSAEALLRFQHDYPDRQVTLHVFNVSAWSGEPSGREGQSIRWTTPSSLASIDLLPADAPIVEALQAG